MGTSAFSFSTCDVAGEVGVAVVGDFILPPGAATVAETDRLRVLAVEAGAPTMDARGLSGGGPIDPRFEGVGAIVVEVLRRVLLFKAAILGELSAEGLRSRAGSALDSDVNDGGRAIRGVAETRDSRRWCTGLLD
jgi:hypothetical protein